jgi:hypothetical protein
MVIDTDRIAREAIDLRPAIAGDRWWAIINDPRTPLPGFLRDTFKARRIRDTGWRMCGQ